MWMHRQFCSMNQICHAYLAEIEIIKKCIFAYIFFSLLMWVIIASCHRQSTCDDRHIAYRAISLYLHRNITEYKLHTKPKDMILNQQIQCKEKTGEKKLAKPSSETKPSYLYELFSSMINTCSWAIRLQRCVSIYIWKYYNRKYQKQTLA